MSQMEENDLFQSMLSVESGNMMKNTQKHYTIEVIDVFFMREDAGKCSMVSMLNGSR